MSSRRSLGVALAFVVLVFAGGDDLAPPRSPDAMVAWVEERGAVTAAFALLRLAALATTVWLIVVAAAVVIARILGAVRVAVAAERILPLAVRRSIAGIGVVSAVALGGPASAQSAQEADGTATMSVLDDEPAPTSVPTTPTTTTTAVPDPAPSADPVAAEEWTVGPGDSFWSIAEEVVGDALGRAPSDVDIDGYWRVLIAANRDRLLSPSPDLIHPGQVFVLPPVTFGA